MDYDIIHWSTNHLVYNEDGMMKMEVREHVHKHGKSKISHIPLQYVLAELEKLPKNLVEAYIFLTDG